MNKQLCKEIVEDINNHAVETLIKYADNEIERMRNSLDLAPDFETVLKAQGYISALKNLKLIRENAVRILNN